MSAFAPGTTPWFLRHELRLTWRYWIGATGGKHRTLIVSFVILGVMALVFGGLGAVGLRFVDLRPLPNMAILIIDAVLAFIFSIMLSQTMAMAALTFHDRGDLDLLLASPARPGRILTVRKVAMAINAMLTFLLLTTPFLVMAAVVGGYWTWLAGLPVLVGLGLLATSIGVASAFGLFRVLGPRRTRTVAQVLGALMGAGIFLVSQTYNILGREASSALWRDVAAWMEESRASFLASWPALAATGDPLPFTVTVTFCLVIFASAATAMGARFAAIAALVAGTGERAKRRPATVASSGRKAVFSGGLIRSLVAKELKLVWRDPALISQVLLQVLYLLPVTFVVMRAGADDDRSLLASMSLTAGAGMVAFLAGQIAAGLGWLTISAEDAPELLTCAPVSPRLVGRAKVAAVVLPVTAIVAAPALALGLSQPFTGLCAFLGGVVGAVLIGYVELWTQKPGKRSEFRMRRKGTGSVWVALLELLLCSLLALTVSLTAMKTPFALIPAFLLALAILPLKKDRWLSRDA